MKLLCNCCNYVQLKPFEHVFLLVFVFCQLKVVSFWPFFTCCRLSSADLPCFLLLSGVCFDPWPFCMGGLPWCLLHPFQRAALPTRLSRGHVALSGASPFILFQHIFLAIVRPPPTHTHTPKKRRKEICLVQCFLSQNTGPGCGGGQNASL